jgi:hypothetical protein
MDRPITELIWAENSASYFDYEMTPIRKPTSRTFKPRRDDPFVDRLNIEKGVLCAVIALALGEYW